VGARFSAPVQTGPGAYPASCTMDTGSFPSLQSRLRNSRQYICSEVNGHKRQWRLQNLERKHSETRIGLIARGVPTEVGKNHAKKQCEVATHFLVEARLNKQFSMPTASSAIFPNRKSKRNFRLSFTFHCQTNEHYKERSRTWEADSRSAAKAFQRVSTKTAGCRCWTVSCSCSWLT
jgi:hypothetical protein